MPYALCPMLETEEQIAELQAILNRTFERAGVHTLSIIRPERRLNARQLVKYLEGMKHIVVGTVTSKGEPRVAPAGGPFLRGRFLRGAGGRALPHPPPAPHPGDQRLPPRRRRARDRRPRARRPLRPRGRGGRGDAAVLHEVLRFRPVPHWLSESG